MVFRLPFFIFGWNLKPRVHQITRRKAFVSGTFFFLFFSFCLSYSKEDSDPDPFISLRRKRENNLKNENKPKEETVT